MDKSPTDKIKAFCTVDPSHLQRDGERIVCTKCASEMAELDAPDGARKGRSKGLLCGVVSAAALGGCATVDDSAPLDDRKIFLGVRKIEAAPVPGGYDLYYGRVKELDAETSEYPRANPVEGKPGMVESPYGGHHVDVSRIPPNSLVIDPNFGVELKKFFRI